MSQSTSIEWTEETWNPIRGCRRVSPGCGGPGDEGGCYAERQGIRFAGPGGPYEGLVKSTPDGPRWAGKGMLDEAKLREPLHWKKPRMVFANSMSDLFFEAFSDEDIARVVAVMVATPGCIFQVLTKRAERMAWLLGSETFQGMVDSAGEAFAAEFGWCHANEGEEWPPKNIWWGVSCEDRKHGLPRLEHLRRTPAAIRFVSFEPLLEDLGAVDLTGIQWAIIGGESGPRSRPCDLAAIRSLAKQARAYGAAPFVKQLGAVAQGTGADFDAVMAAHGIKRLAGKEWAPQLYNLPLEHKKGGDPSEWPEDLRVREMPEVRRGA